MGVNIPYFKIATNQNDILYRLFETGVYEVQDVNPSLAPSMDIQIASNFERFLLLSRRRRLQRFESDNEDLFGHWEVHLQTI